jgi:hypothetical protein
MMSLYFFPFSIFHFPFSVFRLSFSCTKETHRRRAMVTRRLDRPQLRRAVRLGKDGRVACWVATGGGRRVLAEEPHLRNPVAHWLFFKGGMGPVFLLGLVGSALMALVLGFR